MNVNAGPGRPGGPGPPHKRSRPEYHGYDDYPNLREFLERKDEKLPPNHILLITVLNAKYPINVEVMYKVCTIVGNIRRVVCFERNTVVQVMISYPGLHTARMLITMLTAGNGGVRDPGERQ